MPRVREPGFETREQLLRLDGSVAQHAPQRGHAPSEPSHVFRPEPHADAALPACQNEIQKTARLPRAYEPALGWMKSEPELLAAVLDRSPGRDEPFSAVGEHQDVVRIAHEAPEAEPAREQVVARCDR